MDFKKSGHSILAPHYGIVRDSEVNSVKDRIQNRSNAVP